MGAGNGRMWASAPTGVTGTRRGRHTGPPLQVRTGSRANCQGSALIPPRRGRRPRRPASTTKAAPAERGGQGYPGFPRANVFPKGTAFNEAETREGQLSSAGGMEVRACADRPAAAFFSFGPSTAQPLAALPLTDAAYPLRVRPVFFLSRTKRKWGVESRGDHRIPVRSGRLFYPFLQK